jgi:hypothetical protein
MLKKYSKKEVLVDFDTVLSSYSSVYHGKIALSRYKNWFPIMPSSKLAGIIADLMGDGHLQNFPKLRIDYTSKSINELNRFNNEIKSLFGVSGKIRKCKTNNYGTMNLGINNKPLARVLKLICVPTGQKVLKDFMIPGWILENKHFFSRFINRLFCCEAHVDLSSKCIDIKMYKSRENMKSGILFFEQIKNNLEKHFNIKSTKPFLTKFHIRKDGKEIIGVRLKIKNMVSLQRFHKFIGFDNKEKMKRLSQIISSSSASNTISSSSE